MERVLYNYTFISMQQEEANCKIAPLFVTLLPLHLQPTQTARRASGNNFQIHILTFAPFLACICFAIWVFMCVCVSTCLDCWMQTGAKATAPHYSSTPLPFSLALPSLPLLLVYNHSQLAPLSPLAVAASIAWHSHPLETLEAHSA